MGEEAERFLVGREEELERLASALARDRSTAVVGEAGIGKTSLVRAAARASGRRLLEGGGLATLPEFPYLALRRAIGATTLGGDPVRVAARIERLVGPDILFLDDLQWVDAPTRAVLDELADRVLIVAAVRIGDVGTAVAFATADRLELECVQLDALDRASARALVERVRPELPPAGVDRIVERGGGNPLVLEELSTRGESPVNARGLERRLAQLSPAGRQFVRLLAVIDRPIAADVPMPGTAEALDSGLVVRDARSIGIRHALLAEVIRADLDPGDRAGLHRRAARLASDPAEVARHLAAGRRRRQAATTALAAITPETGLQERAALLVIAADAARGSRAAELRLEAARAFDESSGWEAVIATLAHVTSGSDEQLCERDALLAHASYEVGRIEDARAYLGAAATRDVDGAGRAGTRRTIEDATLRVNLDGAVAEALANLQVGLAAQPAGSIGERDIASLQASIGMMATGTLQIDRLNVDVADAFAAERYRTAADRARVVQFAMLIGEGVEPTLEWVTDQAELFRSAGILSVAQGFLADSVHAAVFAGRLTEAVTRADRLLEEPAPARARTSAAVFRARALVLLGRFQAAAEGLISVAASPSPDFFGAGERLGVEAELAYWSGMSARAVELANRTLAIPAPVPGMHTLPGLTRAWAQLELGHRPDPIQQVPLRSLAAAEPEWAGIRLLFERDPSTAANAFREASVLWDRFSQPRRLVARWAEGESLRLAGRLDAAIPSLHDVLDDAVSMGFQPLVARIRRSLRLAGVRTAAEPRSAQVGALTLTPRETELVALVELGLTNIEIARRLGLGRPTVARMLASAMSKVGADRRSQLAAAMAFATPE